MIVRMICHIFFSRLSEHERRTPGHNIGKARLGCIHPCFQRWNTGNNGGSISRTYQEGQGVGNLWQQPTGEARVLLSPNEHILPKTEPYGSLHPTILKDGIPCQVVGCHDKRNGLRRQSCTQSAILLSMKRFFVALAWVLIAVSVTALIIYDMLFLGWIPH